MEDPADNMRVLVPYPNITRENAIGRVILTLERAMEGKLTYLFVDGRNTTIVPIPKLKTPSYLFFAGRRIRSLSYDLAHVHLTKLVRLIRGKPILLTIHGDPFLGMGQEGRRSTLRSISRADVVTCVNPVQAQENGWTWVPNCIDPAEVAPVPAANTRTILFVGRRDPIKGYELFAEATKGMASAKALGLDRVSPWEEVISYMKSAECLVIPSVSEYFSLVRLEAWACGCPVIASNISELSAFGDKATLYVERDPGRFRNAITELQNDPLLRQRLVAEGRREVEGRFYYKRVGEQYLGLYRRALVQK
ncbi:MAG: glycosyltransferase family 4 protein [Conexivisphaerales archaeon]|jgi:glycosyltransferase involved in cell wall biosynthesis